MDPTELEKSVHRALTELPEPTAPPTLLASVMAAVGERERSVQPWYARRWLLWPRGLQLASLATLAAGVFVATRWLGALQSYISTTISMWVRQVVPAGAAISELARSMATTTVIGPWSFLDTTVALLIPVFLTMLATSVVFGLLIRRVARGGALS